MNKCIKFDYGHKSLDFVFVLALLCIFAFCSLVAVILGANTYTGIKASMDSNFEMRTPLSYISTKIRQSDDINSIRVIEQDGIDVLVLESLDGGEICETWIYEYKGSLCEAYFAKGTPFSLKDGLSIIPSYGLEFSRKDNLLLIRSFDQKGKSRSLSLGFRTEQGGEPR